jgi:sterol desaturase/sphingolipid hydroxylase (fatty acid hydroxylase superfamily)
MSHLIGVLNLAFHLGVWLVLLTVILLPLERLFVLHRYRRSPRRIATDLAFYFMNGIVPTIIAAAPLALLAAVVRRATPEVYSQWVGDLPLAVKIAAGLFIAEIGAYWGHRLSHQIPFLWRFHSIHHAPEHIDWLVDTRAHPVDIAVTRLSGLTPLYLLGLAAPAGPGSLVAAAITVFGTFWSFFVHANVRWRLGPLEWLVATPAFHHWHHTNDEHRDHNYAALFPVVDRMFGTHHLPAHWPPVYGIDKPPPDSFIEQLVHPLVGPSPQPVQRTA